LSHHLKQDFLINKLQADILWGVKDLGMVWLLFAYGVMVRFHLFDIIPLYETTLPVMNVKFVRKFFCLRSIKLTIHFTPRKENFFLF